MQKLLFVVLAVSLFGCVTHSRPRANLAIDSDPTPLPEQRSTAPAETSDDNGPSDEPIDLGFEGASGRVRVEAAMTPEEEEEALRDDSEEDEPASDDEELEDSDDEE